MNVSKGLRQVHRWVSMAFTAGVIVNTVIIAGGTQPAFWVYLFALIPLALLLLTGLYLFLLPWFTPKQTSSVQGAREPA